MKCSDLQFNLPLYADDFVGESDAASLKDHLETCPLCRSRFADYRVIKSGLKQLRRPSISTALRNSLKENVRSEIRVEKETWLPVSRDIREWLQMRVMPYGVGVFASVLIGVTFLTMMFSGMLKPGRLPVASSGGSSIMLAANSNPYTRHDADEISPTEYAQTRLGFATESPSINPKGALIALTRSFIRGGMKDDEVVVVADVFSNGLAQIADVVEPSRNQRAVSELEKALDSDPSFAPFVPSAMENRPDSVRVVLKFQSVNVNTGVKRENHR